MTRARHRQPIPPALIRADRSSRFALTFLAFAGLIGPAWALRTHADQLLDATDHRAAVAAPDVVQPSLAADR
ncbi:hypothetical protein [Streptomyces exfoliatus]|uniref:hypothetical protein n=1 Tax=Streptomyces exfoliatus TaxID=1905 RepID=UPI000465B235|nr:hypothetical protein [Streptomyces exfoliatus]